MLVMVPIVAGVAFRDAIELNGGLGILLLRAETAGLVEGSKSGVAGGGGVTVWAIVESLLGFSTGMLRIRLRKEEVAPWAARPASDRIGFSWLQIRCG